MNFNLHSWASGGHLHAAAKQTGCESSCGSLAPEAVAEAALAIKGGKIIVYPTDTVWGIGCDATCDEAVKRIYAIKRRSDFKSLVVLVDGPDMLARHVSVIPPVALDLIEINDKPMTIVYPGAVALSGQVIAEDGTVAIRIPENEFCRALIRKAGRPLVSTSANFSGGATPRKFEEIPQELLSQADYVVDPVYGAGATGRPSQIIRIGLGGEVEIIRQ